MKFSKLLLASALLAVAGASQATLVATPLGPYSQLDDAYTASIYAADTNITYTLGTAFVGNKLVRSADNGTLFVYDPVNTTTVHGNTVHTFTTQTVGGAGWTGRGIVGSGGYLYGNQGGGLRKIDLVANTSTILSNSVGGIYGIDIMPNGNIVYNNNNEVRIYDVTAMTDTVFYSGSIAFGDGLSVTPDGHVVIADLSGYKLVILDSSGNLVNSFNSTHDADGTAYGQGAIFKGNTDGTITKVTFSGPNFSGTGTETTIATGALYHDLAAVGPDNAFYLSALGAHYMDGFQGPYAEGSVIRLSLVGGGGFGNNVPEPASILLFGIAALGLFAARKRVM